jgi:hypothetical protein
MKAQAKEEKLRRQIGMFRPFASILDKFYFVPQTKEKTFLFKIHVVKKFTFMLASHAQ